MEEKLPLSIPAIILMLVLAQILVSASKLERFDVSRAIDGDTIEIRLPDGWVEKVRYIGINTPEVYGEAECFGEEASRYNKLLVADKTVWLEYDVQKRDRYNRILAYVYLDPEGGNMINSLLVVEGFAEVATYPPNVKYVEVFLQLQQEAREFSRGLWGKCRGGMRTTEKNKSPDYQNTFTPVQITCIHFDAAGNDHNNENGEWVVLKASRDVNMKGWRIRDEADHIYDLPDDFRLKEGNSVKIYTGSEEDRRGDSGCGEDPTFELYWGSNSAIWNNTGDTAYLEREGKIVDICSYEVKGGEKEVVCNSD